MDTAIVKEVPLTKGKTAIVDANFPISHKYHVTADGYAVRNFPKENGKRTKIFLHQEVAALHFGPVNGRVVDHINHNPLDNRACNLRYTTYGGNSKNSIKRKNKTGFTGVKKDYNKYQAKISICSKDIYLGSFDTSKDAAVAYDIASVIAYKEFARDTLNFPKSYSRYIKLAQALCSTKL